MRVAKVASKTELARNLGIARGSLYYKPKKPDKDWCTKCKIEGVLRQHPSYGSRRVAITLRLNRKGIQRVMRLYGIKPYRRAGKKYKKARVITRYPNLLLETYPSYKNHIWASDFTYLKYQKKFIYVATVMDLYSREILGLSVMNTHANTLVISALMNTLHTNPRPEIYHSDNGSEYDSKIFKSILLNLNTNISRSKPGCPWENGYQESFYGKFKIDLGDPNRFDTLGELVFNIYQTIHNYNHHRIHSALGMSPVAFQGLQVSKSRQTLV